MKICVSQKRVLLLLREVYLPTEPVQQRSGRWVHLSFLLCKKKRGGGRERLLSPSSFWPVATSTFCGCKVYSVEFRKCETRADLDKKIPLGIRPPEFWSVTRQDGKIPPQRAFRNFRL